jgi:nitroimidazol reductase NimA-like FMN-containing flavoprotein (pyridoxamine 5'-phosphate oxidase superfamily)
MQQTGALSPTDRTAIHRGRDRAMSERDVLLYVLAAGLVAHVGFSTATHPVVLPMAYAVDPDGPDRDGTLYLHGSVAARMLQRRERSTLCVTVTLLDGLALARSGFHHSMNYRIAVVIGPVRHVEDEAERARALDGIVDHGPGSIPNPEGADPQGARRHGGARPSAPRGLGQGPPGRSGGRAERRRHGVVGRARAREFERRGPDHRRVQP